MNMPGVLESARKDLQYALRTLRNNPAFAVTAILTLALAIGGNTAMFTVIHSVLLNPLEFHDPEQLIRITGGATPSRFEEMRADARLFSGIGAYTNQEDLTLTGAGEPEVVSATRVSANFLQILNVTPLHGRGFLPAEDTPGAPPVALISAELWRRRFSGDPQIIGKTINLGATPFTIVGVLPPLFQFPYSALDVWATRPVEWPQMPPQSRALSPFLTVFGRMKPGVTLDQANAEMTVIQHRYAAAHPTALDAKGKSALELTRMKDQLVSGVRAMLWTLFGAVCFVLLIACANVANLLLARSASRAREFAVRSALGASRSRLVRQLLAESVLLSVFGGMLGVLLAAWSIHSIHNITAFSLPRAAEIHLDWTVLAFAAAISIGTGMLFGLAPSLNASKPDLITALRARGEASGQGVRGRVLSWLSLRSLLVVAQVALSVMLLIGAALLLQSVIYLRNVNLGFNPANLLTLRVSLPLTRYDTLQKKSGFFEDFRRRVQTVPGVQAATIAWFLPMSGFAGSPVQDANQPPLKLNERPIAKLIIVTPDYFRTLSVAIRHGRDFNEHDMADSQRVAIIDESFARRFWPSDPNPVGQRIIIGFSDPRPTEIVGIVANVHQELEDNSWPQSVYVAFAQHAQPSAMLAARTAGDPTRLTGAIRQQLREMDRDQPIATVRTMEALVDDQIGQRRLTVTLLGAFAGVALLLALIGIYGVIAYSVVQRTQEIGIRRALGAQHGNILGLVVGQGLGLALAGVVVGVAGALGLTSVLKHLLFQVSATDPATFAGIAVLFVIVALAASYIPAHRATLIDPLKALQAD